MSDTSSEPVKGQWRGDKANINREGGPAKTHWWSELLKERAELEAEVRRADGKMEKLKNKEIMADALIEKAKQGDTAAIKEFADRIQGKAPQSIGTLDEDGAFQEQTITVRFE